MSAFEDDWRALLLLLQQNKHASPKHLAIVIVKAGFRRQVVEEVVKDEYRQAIVRNKVDA